ncbi:MAG: sugar phosphate isomerase/epimerase [Chloroflexi bacterium]|nr:sugar phosphate isomerase/epimerase [Chloroflexota bacterium]MCL5275201.1 sugar phosphate isomerase/epimerase [Chloroflexota bacterium]
MRFGIMEMQLGMLIPADAPPHEIMARVAGFEHVELTRRLASSGFKVVELGGDLTLFFPSAYSPAAMEKLAALKQELGLSYTVHLPLWSIEPSTPLTPVRRGSASVMIDIIRATLPLQPEDYVIHATGPLAAEFYRMSMPAPAHTLLLRQFQNYARDSLDMILRETGIPSRKLAIETIEFPFDLTVELADELDTSICLDTGHILSGFSGAVELFAAVERCLPRLSQVHLHDAPQWHSGEPIVYGKDHQPLGAGNLDVGRLLDRLAAANFTGPLVLELTVQQALDSLDVIRKIRPGMVD